MTDIGQGFWAPVVVGDFNAKHACKFLRHLLPAHSLNKEWKKVYKVRDGQQCKVQWGFDLPRTYCF
jgi:hypothetical protein